VTDDMDWMRWYRQKKVILEDALKPLFIVNANAP